MQGPAVTGNQADSASGRRSNSPHSPCDIHVRSGGHVPDSLRQLVRLQEGFRFHREAPLDTAMEESERDRLEEMLEAITLAGNAEQVR